MLGTLRTSISPPALLLLTLLGSMPFSLFSLLLLLSAEAAADASVLPSSRAFGGAVQRGTSQTTPVKLLSVNPPRFHLRQGLPERSRARRPALMAPWFALGPSLWTAPFVAFGSMVPSSLQARVSIRSSGQRMVQASQLTGEASSWVQACPLVWESHRCLSVRIA